MSHGSAPNPDELPPALPGRTPPPRPKAHEVDGIVARTLAARDRFALREFARRTDGMIHAMDGGMWLHFHVWMGRPMAHLVSTDRELLLTYGAFVGIPADRLQDKPLKDPRTGVRRAAWHWDLGGPYLPPSRLVERSPERSLDR
jgi:hypothetical protein